MDDCHFNCITKLKKKKPLPHGHIMHHLSRKHLKSVLKNFLSKFIFPSWQRFGVQTYLLLMCLFSFPCACPNICHPSSSCFSSFFLVFAIVVYRSFLIVLIILLNAPLVPCCLKNKQLIA
jgi:hypothetical protein